MRLWPTMASILKRPNNRDAFAQFHGFALRDYPAALSETARLMMACPGPTPAKIPPVAN